MVTLACLLDDPALALRPVVAGRRDDPVRWVATSEIDDPAPYLEGGEVLLTTGLEKGSWRSEWDGYVSRLAVAGVVAIGVGTGFTMDRVPEDLAAACRRHSVDLFEVPRATRFVAISRSVAQQLQLEAESAARKELAVQRALTRAALEDDPERAIVAAVARSGVMAALTGADGIAVAGPLGDRPELFDARQVGAAIGRIRHQALRAAASLSAGGTQILIQPVGIHSRPSRYLVVAFAGRSGEAVRSSAATAVVLLSLADERRQTAEDAERRLRCRAVEVLISGDAATSRVLLGARAGSRRNLPHRLAVLRAAPGAGPAAALDDALVTAEAAGVAGVLTAGEVRELVVAVQADLAASLARDLAAAGLRVGIGDQVSVDDAQRSYATAGHALAMSSTQAPVVSWGDGIQRGVLSLLDADRAAAFGVSFLAPLQAGGPLLVEALASFVRHNGSLLKVADDLGVHRNTVRHRIERIEELLHRSLAEPQARVDAWVALQAQLDASSP